MISPDVTLLKNYIVYTGSQDFQKNTTKPNYKLILDFLVYAENNGTVFTKKAISTLTYLSKDELLQIKDYIKPIQGIKFRKSFGTINDKEFTLNEFTEQIIHYLVVYGLEIPDDEFVKSKIQEPNFETPKNIRTIDSKTIDEFKEDIKSTITSPVVFGKTQKLFIEEAHKNNLLYGILQTIQSIKVKENLMFILSTAPDILKEKDYLKTTTDILRFIYLLNDYSYKDLDTGLKFKLKTSQKKIVLRLLDKYGYPEELKKYKSQWLSIGMCIRPGSSKFNKYKRAQKLFDLLRNTKIRTFFSVLDTLKSDTVEYTKHLSQRPGELMRRLDYIIRNSNHIQIEKICEVLKSTDINPKLNMQMIAWLRYRASNSIENRVFNVKGTAFQSNKDLDALNFSETSMIIKVLEQKLREHLDIEFFGKNVKLSEDLKNYIVPIEMRDNSVFDKITYTPGSRIKIQKNILRVFSAWGTKPGKSNRYDLDLSALLVNDKETRSIYFGDQTSEFVQHSGDFTSCMTFEPGKTDSITSEYIDINVKELAKNYDYIVLSSIIFDTANTSDFDTDVHVYSGITQKNKKTSGVININDSSFKMKLKGPYQSHISFAIDLKTMEIVIIDKYSTSNTGSTVNSISKVLETYKRKYFNANKYSMSMYELLSMLPEVSDNAKDSEKDTEIIDTQYISDNLEKILNTLS